jgi:Zn-dependent peptidase ImmA (M78 family)
MDELEIEYYHIVDDKALQIRLDYNLFEKDIDIYLLLRMMGIVLVKYSSLNKVQFTLIRDIYGQNDGLSIKRNGSYYVFYNDNMIETRTKYTLAHEIDHITDNIHPIEKYIEKVADHFARSLLIPQCVLIYENYNDPYKVADDFNVSYSAATYALESAIRWKNHPNFKFTEKEIEYLKLYKKYLEIK